MTLMLAIVSAITAQDITFAGVSMHNQPGRFLAFLRSHGFTTLVNYGQSVSVTGTYMDKTPDFFEVATFEKTLVYEIHLGYGFKTQKEALAFKDKAINKLKKEYSGFNYSKEEVCDKLSGDGGQITIFTNPKSAIAGGDKLYPKESTWVITIYFNCYKKRHYYHYYINDSTKHTVSVFGYELSKTVKDKTGVKDGHLVIPEYITINGVPYKTTEICHNILSNNNFGDTPEIYSIKLPNNVTEISYNAFSSCIDLKEITLGNNLKTIGDYAFSDCRKLKTINLPATVEHLGQNVFEHCFSLETINVEQGNKQYKSVDGVLFSAKGDTLILMPGNYKTHSYIVPNGVKHIADFAMVADSLKHVTLPEGLESIGNCAFRYDNSLKSINIPSSVKKIGIMAFKLCTKLEKIVLPEKLDSIPEHCFMQCMALKQITLPKTLKHISALAFADCGVEELSLPKSLETIDHEAFADCFNLRQFKIEEGNKNYTVRDGVLFSDDGITLLAFPALSRRHYSIPEGVKIIDNCAFYSNNLQSITLPNSLTTIRNNAFYNSKSLIEIHIPKNVKVIGDYTFAACDNLKAIHLENIDFSCGYNVAGGKDSIFYIPDALYKSVNGNSKTMEQVRNNVKLKPESNYRPSQEITLAELVTMSTVPNDKTIVKLPSLGEEYMSTSIAVTHDDNNKNIAMNCGFRVYGFEGQTADNFRKELEKNGFSIVKSKETGNAIVMKKKKLSAIIDSDNEKGMVFLKISQINNKNR